MVALVFVILLQRSSSDGLAGLAGGGGGGAGGIQVRGSGNVLTKMTGYLATGFIVTSLSLAYLANQAGESLVENINSEVPTTSEPAVKLVDPVVPLAE